MRDIKFRAWCETTKKIYQITDIDFNNYVANGVCCGDWQEFSTSKLLQYTGIKDKNGKEIYEGDIIVYPRLVRGKHTQNITEIVFKDGVFRLKENKTCIHDFATYSLFHLCEVVGNIYETRISKR